MEGDVCAKSVRIRDLPFCQFRDYLARITDDSPSARVWVVAKEGAIADWAVYIGWPETRHLKESTSLDQVWYCEHQHSVEQVMETGDKLEQGAAEELFPDWVHLRYRI